MLKFPFRLAGPFRGNYSNWPMVGEIDIMESMNDMTTKFSTFHCGTMPGFFAFYSK